MNYTPAPLDERDKQALWTMLWIAVTGLFAGLVIAYDVYATQESVLLTYSFNGGYYFVRAPWLVSAIVGVVAHMAMQQDIAIADGWSVWVVLLITAVYALVWHAGQWAGWWHVMGYWAMYVSAFVVSPIVWSYIFSLRPTY